MTHIAHKDIVTGCSMVSGHFDYSNKILLRDGGFEKNGKVIRLHKCDLTVHSQGRS